MSSTRLIAVAVVPVMLGIGGCNVTPNYDTRFGYAVNTAKAQQTINPDAALNADPVTGLDGESAKQSIERYQNTFKEPPPTFQIFFGGPNVQSR
jgi:hypothetical protein